MFKPPREKIESKVNAVRTEISKRMEELKTPERRAETITQENKDYLDAKYYGLQYILEHGHSPQTYAKAYTYAITHFRLGEPRPWGYYNSSSPKPEKELIGKVIKACEVEQGIEMDTFHSRIGPK